jgi:type VI secretion system protein ImpF
VTNTKHEYRNPKQIRNLKFEGSKQFRFEHSLHSCFEFVSDLVLRISDLKAAAFVKDGSLTPRLLPMSNTPLPGSLKPSVLDRLVDASTQGSGAPAWYDLDQMTAAVERDLEDLLNTRQTHQGACDDYPEVQQSLLTYGLPDAASMIADTPQQRLQLARRIEQIVSRFEPRLKQTRVRVLDPIDHVKRVLRFQIVGRLQVEPAVDLELDASMKLTTGQLTITSAQS